MKRSRDDAGFFSNAPLVYGASVRIVLVACLPGVLFLAVMDAPFLSIQKLRGKGIIFAAAKHNLREFMLKGEGDHGAIEEERTHLNQVLRGEPTALGVAQHAQSLITQAGIKSLRKDAVLGLEIVVSLPASTEIDCEDYFSTSIEWVERSFAVPILSAVVHFDQSAPHCHMLLLPLVDKRMVGSDLMGGRSLLRARQDDFYASVGKRFGLVRRGAQKKVNQAIASAMLEKAFQALQLNSALGDDLLRALLRPHAPNPLPLMEVLGLQMPPRPRQVSKFVEMMTKPCGVEAIQKDSASDGIA